MFVLINLQLSGLSIFGILISFEAFVYTDCLWLLRQQVLHNFEGRHIDNDPVII